MALSPFLRRSGVAIVLITDRLGNWTPDTIVQAGVGLLSKNKEVEVFQEMWPMAKLIGFEPVPWVARDLRKEYPGELHAMAVADAPGTADIYIKAKHTDGSSLSPFRADIAAINEIQTVPVKVETLDRMIPDPAALGKVLLWLDAEGAELRILKGAEELLPHCPIVNVELTSKPVGDTWCSPVEVDDWLRARGYFLQWIHTQRSSAGQVDGVYVKGDLFDPRYCCIPDEVRRWRWYEEVWTGDFAQVPNEALDPAHRVRRKT